MARVNHKRVKELLNEHRSKISDRQFFTSRILAGHFEDIAAAQTKRYHYKRRIRVNLIWEPKQSGLACTNDEMIQINAGHKFVTKHRNRQERYDTITGVFAHELGHTLFTDFLVPQTHTNFLGYYKWYPAPPPLKTTKDLNGEKEFWDYAKADSKHLEMLLYLAHYINNILEDGYIENRMLNQFPGVLGYCLQKVRDQQFKDGPTVSQMVEVEEDSGHIFQTILQCILSYVKFGEIKYGEDYTIDERVETVFEMLDELDSAIINKSAKNRCAVTNYIMVHCWEYLKDFLDKCAEAQAAAEAAGASGGVASTLSEKLSAISGTSAQGAGSTASVDGEDGSPIPAMNSGARSLTRTVMAQNESESEEEDESESGGTGETSSESEETDASGIDPEESSEDVEAANAKSSSSGEPLGFADGSTTGGSQKQETTDSEQGRIPYQQTSSVSEPLGGETVYDEDYQREHDKNAASDIERMLEKMEEKAACLQAENERLSEMNEAAQSISYGDIHAGVNMRVHRINEVDEELMEQYDAISAPLLTISAKLRKTLVKQLKDRQRGGKMTGLVMGRRLDAHALCRNDGKVFYKNNLPNEIPQLSVALLLDESGSMSSCDRSTYARATAIVLYDFCTSLDIPIMVYGHSTGWGSGVDLYSYAEFESIDGNDRYRMMDISARSSNRDGAALRFVAEQLSKRTEDVRLLILVSDGQPADSGYYGTAAEEDLRGIKQEYKRKGIVFVAAAIGDDKANIERIYGDSFLDITDLNELPKKLTEVVKRYLKT